MMTVLDEVEEEMFCVLLIDTFVKLVAVVYVPRLTITT